MKPLFFFDTETSGTDPERHAILQIAWLIDIGGEIVHEQVFDVLPAPDDELVLAALDVNNFTLERMRAGKSLSYVVAALKGVLDENIPLSFLPVGHNVNFDVSFLITAFKKTNAYFRSIDFKRPLDTRALATYCAYRGLLETENYKLETLANHFSIPIDAHDALSDIRATRTLFYKLHDLLKAV